MDHHLASLDEIEVLLAAFARRGQPVRPDQVAADVRKSPDTVRPHLERLAAGGFLVHHQPDDMYLYPERNSDLDTAVEQLAQLYEQRPVTLIKALYERPSTAVLSFADAFRLRKG